MAILLTIADIVTELLDHDPKLVIISRKNFNRTDTNENYIVIDNIINLPIGKLNYYDANTQTQSLITRYKGDFQISFYGINALANAIVFENMLMSEKSFTLQSEVGITIYLTSSHNNLRIQDGTNWDELYQADFKVQYDEKTDVSALTIETGVFELHQENAPNIEFETKEG